MTHRVLQISSLAPVSRYLLTTAALILLALSVFLASAVPASADIVFGEQGSGAGKMERAEDIAVDNSNGHLYVADRGNNRIDVFEADGIFLMAFGWGVADGTTEALQACTTTCFAGLEGGGAGEFHRLQEVAVDNSSGPSAGDVYAVDDLRVEKFDPTAGAEEKEAEFLRMWGRGVNSGSSGNSGLCTNAGPPTDICGVGTVGKGAGQFTSIGGLDVAPDGSVYVADSSFESEGFANRVEEFEPSGTFIKQLGPLAPTGASTLFVRERGLAVDSDGDFYVATPGATPGPTGAVRKYDPNGVLLATLNPSDEIHGIALDLAGDLFVHDNDLGASAIAEYDSVGAELRVFDSNGTLKGASAFALYSNATGDIFALEEGGSGGPRIAHIAIPPPGPLVSSGSSEASPIGNLKANLKANLNPEGKATTVHFQYVDEESFKHEGGFTSPHTKTTAESPPVGSDFTSHLASVLAIELTPETAYLFRAVATNLDGTVVGETTSFTTRPPLEIDATFSTDVGTDAANLHAEVSPLGIPATGYFQYVDDATYRADIEAFGPGHGFDHATDIPDVSHAAPPIDLGSGEAPKSAAAFLYPLAPGTTYHYRILAIDSFATVSSEVRTFTTFAPPTSSGEGCPNQDFRTAASAALPDCRAYEMVSPVDKANGSVIELCANSCTANNGLDQSASAGEKLTYSSYRAFGGAESSPWGTQYLATRIKEKGWSTEPISPPSPNIPVNEGVGVEAPFKAFSPDLCQGWLQYLSEPPLEPLALPGKSDLYHRGYCGGEASYEALIRGEHDGTGTGELQGISADGSDAVFRVAAHLTPEAYEAPSQSSEITQLYETSAGGSLRLLSVLPDGSASELGSTAGTAGLTAFTNGREVDVSHALSADGSRVYWTASAGRPNGDGTGTLYLRQNADQPQSKIVGGKCTQPAKACTVSVSATVGPGAAQFWAAAADGSVAIFSIGRDLYKFNAAEGKSTLIAHEVNGVVGASEDATRVYFASEEALTGANAQGKSPVSDEPNLYLGEAGAFTFVATLSDKDASERLSPISNSPRLRTAQVSPDGQSLIFMSDSNELSEATAGYDSTPANPSDCGRTNGGGIFTTGPCAEVYLYDATAGSGQGRLVCASCNPTGGRPLGKPYLLGEESEKALQGAATIPTWETQLYDPRALSVDGHRLFFNSFEALVPTDTNGAVDVYQWEARGSGDCSEADSTFNSTSAGCVRLISSGQNPGGAEFLDANESGSEVFFKTAASLLPQDPGLIDIYDANIDGGFLRPQEPPAACEGEACQSPPEAPNDPTPASSSFEGAGNIKEEPQALCAKGKARRKGRCVPKKPKRAHKKPKRSNSNRRAGK